MKIVTLMLFLRSAVLSSFPLRYNICTVYKFDCDVREVLLFDFKSEMKLCDLEVTSGKNHSQKSTSSFWSKMFLFVKISVSGNYLLAFSLVLRLNENCLA